MPRLFDPWQLGPLALDNRILIAPMCQYSAVDGVPADWHTLHLGQLAMSGAALLIVEATAVSAQGRITPGCTGLYDDAQEAAFARLLALLRRVAPIKLAVQLGHAGRKASSRAPWDGGLQIPHDEPGGWPAVSASALPHAPGEEAPAALDAAGLRQVRQDFVDAAQRAVRAGFDGIELHAAHGYLLHQFLSPISNRREDDHGGSLERRLRFPLEVFDAVRAAVPAQLPVWVRVSATDWVDGGWDLDSTIAFGQAMKVRGCAAMHVSSGGISPLQRITLGPGYQVPLAQAVKAAVGLPTIACGLITEPEQAEAVVAEGRADAVALARAMLYDPRWPWHAAARLGAQVEAPKPYWRAAPRDVKDLFKGSRIGMR
ncbi:MAG: NADH:flavin oxidoreductase/NADH oxidase [Rubrivivax sp.]|nr:NADH:flavin oxidoreductase/NADH oxidase [Rubrivivax sp.]